jgi:hypothetical protein
MNLQTRWPGRLTSSLHHYQQHLSRNTFRACDQWKRHSRNSTYLGLTIRHYSFTRWLPKPLRNLKLFRPSTPPTSQSISEVIRETASAYMPTHSEMISNVQGFWPRMQMRTRLLLMGRHRRPWKMDDVLAVFSWVSVGTSFFILAGTTTAVSLLVAAANSIRVQGMLL